MVFRSVSLGIKTLVRPASLWKDVRFGFRQLSRPAGLVGLRITSLTDRVMRKFCSEAGFPFLIQASFRMADQPNGILLNGVCLATDCVR